MRNFLSLAIWWWFFNYIFIPTGRVHKHKMNLLYLILASTQMSQCSSDMPAYELKFIKKPDYCGKLVLYFG